MVPLAVWLLGFPLSQTDWIRQHDRSIVSAIVDAGYETAGQNADVVIFGDSAAIYGLDARRLSERLALHAINLPNTRGTLEIAGDLNLRHYLAVNRPPRLIVFYFSAWDLNYSDDRRVSLLFEAQQ